MHLYTKKLITYEEAMRQSTNPDDFALKVSGISSQSDSSWDEFTQEIEGDKEEDKSFIEK
jgi:twitching motility protein PilT